MENSKIEWCDHTFNAWEGCAKVSPGCLHCYAETRNHRFGNDNWGKGKPRRRTSVANWKLPLKWNREVEDEIAERCKSLCDPSEDAIFRPRIFCASLSDWLDDEVPIEWLADLLKLIHDTPNLDWLLLTKRPENWLRRIEQALISTQGGDAEDKDWFVKHGKDFPVSEFASWLNVWTGGDAPSNVWIGTSVENQDMADNRIPLLSSIPAKVRFLSVEPMLEEIRLSRVPVGCGIHWSIFGGESGPGARPCNVAWIRDGVSQCREMGIAPFVKQLGSDARRDNHGIDSDGCKVDITNAPCYFRHKKGGDMSEWPGDLCVREFPL